MVRMQNKDAVQRPYQHRIRFVRLTRSGKHHVHEVGGVRQIVFGVVERQAVGIAVAHGRNGGDFGNHAGFGNAAVIRIADVQTVLVKRRQSTHHTHHHRHRVRIATETAEKPSELFVHHIVAQNGGFKLLFLLCIGQFAVEQQIAGFQIIAGFSQLLNRIATVIQLTFIAINKGDFRFARGGGGKAGVESEHIGTGVQFADINHIRAEGAA